MVRRSLIAGIYSQITNGQDEHAMKHPSRLSAVSPVVDSRVTDCAPPCGRPLGVPDRLRFGIFEADLRTGELRKRRCADQASGATVSSARGAAGQTW